jgi:mannose-6-phosphate isomerase
MKSGNMLQDKIYKLKGKVQHYAWGGFEFIPQLIGFDNEAHQPCAEYWMGAHPSAPAVLTIDDATQSLNAIINSNPAACIGEKVHQQFGGLPYLFKVLDVKDMLSIQVHPSKAEAIKGFEAEEAAGIPINAPHRNYKDKNHKPEVMVALSPFWLLHGFKQADELLATLESVPEFEPLISVFQNAGYQGLYETVMTMPQAELDALLLPLVQREMAAKKAGTIHHKQPGWWVSKLFEQDEALNNLDKGIFSIYFFNIVEMQPGEAIFQAAGVPHAYLEGQNIELMANSDNVLRGGLTPKHVDVSELLKHTVFEGITPQVMQPNEHSEQIYPCPVADFGIARIGLNDNTSYSSQSQSAEIFIVTEGVADFNQQVRAAKGEVVIVFANQSYQISSSSTATLFKAFVP